MIRSKRHHLILNGPLTPSSSNIPIKSHPKQIFVWDDKNQRDRNTDHEFIFNQSELVQLNHVCRDNGEVSQ